MSKDLKHEELFSVVEKSSENIENDNLQKLKKVFPQFVKNGEVDFDALQAFLKKDGVLSGEEKYGLNWSGKSNAFKAIRTPATGTLVPEKDKSKNWDDTENIFIEGDNLEVLKLLQKHYREKIKMIYIDPPYNTGKDFVYKDNFTQGVSDYYEQTGQTKGGIKMTANTEKNGRYHSDWLTMMYPRLFLARNLLKEDGVIFVSIDDNEVANLRLMMDEIFGEEGFVACLKWKRKKQPSFLHGHVAGIMEYVLVYAKDIDVLEKLSIEKRSDENTRLDNEGNSISERIFPAGILVKAKDIEEIKKGIVKIKSMEVEYLDNVSIKDGKTAKPLKIRARFRNSQEQIDNFAKNGLIFITTNLGLRRDLLPEEKEKRKSITDLLLDWGDNQDSDKEISSLFEGGKPFDYPKPLKLIKNLAASVFTQDEIILDFFSGSGTTAQAIMDLSAEDSGNRKWICVQLPETIDENSEVCKAGYKNISEISRERIRRAGDKIGKGDMGFKSYKLSSSNYRKWDNITEENAEELVKQSKLFIESPLVDNFIPENVVHEIALKEGFGLNADLRQDKGDLKVYMLQDGDRRLLVTFSTQVTKENVLKLNPLPDDVFVCFDNMITDTEKINIRRIINLKTM